MIQEPARLSFIPDSVLTASKASSSLTATIAALLLAAAMASMSAPLAARSGFDGLEQPAPADPGSENPEDPEIQRLLNQAKAASDRGWLVSPRGRSAVDRYLQILDIDPSHRAARVALSRIQRQLVDDALTLAEEADSEAATRLLDRAASLGDDPLLMLWARAHLERVREQQLLDAEQAVRELIARGLFDAAEDRMTELVAMGMERKRLNAIRTTLTDARLYGSLRAGQTFSDPLPGLDAHGPIMVVVPAGSFMKGSPDSESGRLSHEGPRYRVSFERGFALAQTETTVGDFRRFVDDTGYQTDAERRGWARVYETRSGRMTRRNRVSWRQDYLGREAGSDLPVIHVSWRDADAYAAWLAERTDRPYRLPSEAEFEYALRAGTQTPFWWGDGAPPEPVENLTGDGDISPTNSRWSVAFSRYTDGFWGPAPVASLAPNPFGLYDMGGNVMEWTEDCWHDSFVRAPVDGSAWVNPGCTHRVIRGGSWSSTPDMSRSAYRISGAQDSTDMRLGFRVARDL